jgi:hypothetical protein
LNISRKYESGLRMLKLAAVPAALMVAPNAAHAGFIGYYDPTNWTFTNAPGDGSVDTSGAPNSITVTGANNGSCIGCIVNYNTDYTITAAVTGTWTFDWQYSTADLPGYDWGGYLLNGVFAQLATNGGDSGNISLAVNAGDVIGFRVNCTDCVAGAGTISISNFSALSSGASAAPEPSSLALMALGASGIVAARRRRRVQ